MARPIVIAQYDGETLSYAVVGIPTQPLGFQPRAGERTPERVPEHATVTMGPESWTVPISDAHRDLQSAAIRWDREQYDAEHAAGGLLGVMTHPENTTHG